MNLFKRIREEVIKEELVVSKIITEYFTGYKTIMSLRMIDFDAQILKFKYNIYIDDMVKAIDIEVSYLYSEYVLVTSVVGSFERIVTGYLEQTIKRELLSA